MTRKRLFHALTFLALLALVACAGNRRKKDKLLDDPRPELAPATGKTTEWFEVRDTYDRERLGFVKTVQYSNGQVLKWVLDPEREDQLGYITAEGMAVKLVWSPGATRAVHKQLGIDTVTVGARKILDYGDDVVLHRTTMQALADELMDSWKKDDAAAGGGAGCGG